MSCSCCESTNQKQPCPVCVNLSARVTVQTISHHIKKAWGWSPTTEHYYFCENPECNVVYFGNDGSTINTSDLATTIGIKGQTDEDILCYCFNVTYGDYQNDPSIKDYVMAQTKAGLCSCETSNPSGRCCLKDFPK